MRKRKVPCDKCMIEHDENDSVDRRAGVTSEDVCCGCPCFRAYQVGSPGRARGLIGDCTWCRAEQPHVLPAPAPGKFFWMPPCER